MTYSRNCPDCNDRILYKTKKRRNNSNKINSKCTKCQGKYFRKLYKGKYTRICKLCGRIISYNSKLTYKHAEIKNGNCLQCFLKRKNKKWGREHRGKFSPCYGRVPSKEERYKISKSSTGRKQTEKTKEKRFYSTFKITYKNYLASLPNWKRYKKIVINITKKQPLHTLKNYNKRGRYAYHLDHIVSIFYGFENKIPPEKVGNIKNLQMLWWKKNLKKSYKVENNSAKEN